MNKEVAGVRTPEVTEEYWFDEITESPFGLTLDNPEAFVLVGQLAAAVFREEYLPKIVTGRVASMPLSRWDTSRRAIKAAVQQVASSKDARIQRKGKGFTITLGVGDFQVGLDNLFSRVGMSSEFWSWVRPDPGLNTEDVSRASDLARKLKAEGIDLLEPSRAINLEVPLSDFLLTEHKTLLSDRVEVDELDAMLDGAVLHVYSPGRNKAPVTERKFNGKEYVESPVEYQSARNKLSWLNAAMRSRSLHIGLKYFLDNKAVAALTNTNPAELKPSYLGILAENFFKAMVGDAEGMWTIRPLSAVDKANQQVNKGRGKSRAGFEGLMVTDKTQLVYVPDVGDVDGFENTVEQYGTLSDGTYSLNPELFLSKDPEYITGDDGKRIQGPSEADQRKVLRVNGVIYTDWASHRLVIAEDGVTRVVPTDAWGPARPYQVERVLTQDIEHEAISGILRRAARFAVGQGLVTNVIDNNSLFGWSEYEAGYYLKQLYSKESNPTQLLRTWMTAAIHRLSNLTEDDRRMVFEQNPGMDMFEDATLAKLPTIQVRDLSLTSPIPLLRAIAEMVSATYTKLKTDPNTFMRLYATSTYMRDFAFLHCMVKFASEEAMVTLRSALQEDLKPYGAQPADVSLLPKDYAIKPVSNIQGVTLLPHQVKATYSLEKLPKLAILDVAAGGGKTMTVIIDAMRKLDAGLVKRVLVLCPSHLVGDYVKEANFASKGTINVIPLTGSIKNAWGESSLEKLILNSPPNTFVVASYDFLTGARNEAQELVYLDHSQTIYANVEFLRAIGFDVVYLDELHFLKNQSNRAAAARRLIADIPYRVGATGTMYQTKLEDVVNQLALFDPGIFGSSDSFTNTYGYADGANVNVEMNGRQVNISQFVSREMRKYVQVITCHRKEWASLLPPREVEFHFVDLTVKQRKIYQAILEQTLEEIRKDEELMALLESGDEDEAVQDALEARLAVYLQRIERFLAAPGADELGHDLGEEDKVSPKGKKVASLMKEHMRLYQGKAQSKILVFTSYIDSAEAIFNALPEDLQRHAILYKAETKLVNREQFEKDPNKWLMVGVEQSMNTGVNAQFANRLIRIESVFSPGTLEQGEARVNRPNVKVKEQRTKLHYDWVVCDKSVDVTKIGRLIARTIQKVKFDNPDDQRYQSLDDVEMLRLNLNTIMEENSFEESLSEHLDAYIQLTNKVEREVMQEYREKHKDLKQLFRDVPTDGPIEGSKLLKHVPYAPGADIYSMDELGLVTFSEYERKHYSEDWEAKGLFVHTEFGEGQITRENKDSVRVKLNDGSIVTVPKLSTFVITRKETSTKQIRQKLAETVEMPTVDAMTVKEKKVTPPAPVKEKPVKEKPVKEKQVPEIPVEQPTEKKRRDPVPSTDEEEGNGIELFIGVYNEYVSLMAEASDPDVQIHKRKLIKQGFVEVGSPFFAYVPTYKHLQKLIPKLEESFKVPPTCVEELNKVLEGWKTMGKQSLLRAIRTTGAELRNFYLTRKRKQPPGYLYVYPMISDGELYLMVDAATNPSAIKLPSLGRIPGVKWEQDDAYLMAFFTTKPDAKEVILEIEKTVGILNLEDLKNEYKAIKKLG